MSGDPRRRLHLIATDDGQDEAVATAREVGLQGAHDAGAAVVLYDRASESYLTDPYPAGPWSDEADALSGAYELDPVTLHNLGRAHLAGQLEQALARGLEAHAYLAEGHGAEALADAIWRWAPDLVVLPSTLRRPGLVDRLKGNTLEQLRKAGDVEMVTAGPEGIDPS